MDLRQNNIDRLGQQDFDVLIVGGGINGSVSAAALAARGAKVGLIDARDFAGFTSQESSNLVWGGIKYMEGYEFGLVNGLCRSRNELLDSFPSTVKEIRFLMTINRQFRFHPWIILASTWLYWLFGRGKTRTPRLLTPARIRELEPVIDAATSTAGVECSDAFLHDNDARFVFNFVRSAMDRGCAAANYVEAVDFARGDQGDWITRARDSVDGRQFNIRSRVLINAAGAFVDRLNAAADIETVHRHLFSKGIHLIVPQLSQGHRVLAFFADDERLFFAIPMANRTCIGTTDTLVEEPVTAVDASDRDFVLSNINARLDLARPLTGHDIIAERCGVRPLAIRRDDARLGDFRKLSRKHIVETTPGQRHISIFGGKLTDCINVGDEICAEVGKLGVELQPRHPWFGEPGATERQAYFERAAKLGLDRRAAEDTGETLDVRLWRRYGGQASTMLDAIEADPAMAEPLIENTGFRRCEIEYIAQNEMIVYLEDYLRRRSKIELLMARDQLRNSAGLREACEILFGDQAPRQFADYFNRE